MPAELPERRASRSSTRGRATRSSASSCSATSRPAGIKDVVFVTGDIHTFIAGDVRTARRAGPSVAVEFVGGSITSRGHRRGRGAASCPATTATRTPRPACIDASCAASNPWVDQADLDHHGYGGSRRRSSGFDCEFVRMATIKRRSRAKLPSTGFRYSIARGQTSIKGVNGPAA